MTPADAERSETPKRRPRKRAEGPAKPLIEPESLEEPAFAEDEPVEPKPRGLYLTPRQAFIGLAVVLIVALLALLAYLLYLLQPHGLGQRGGAAVDGIQPLFTIQGPGTGKQPTFDRPLGVTFGADGRIYIADTGNNRVCMFDRNGGFLKEWGGFGVAKPAPGGVFSWKPGKLNFPDGIAAAENGDVYVADFRNDCVEVFDKDGKWLRRFPDPTKPVGKGSSGQDGRGIAVTAVAVKAGKVYATDTYQVFVFTTEGKLLSQFGKPGSGPGDIDHPNGIAVADDGTIYVADSNHARVTAFTPEGKPKWNAGRIPAGMNDTSTAAFELPRGIGVLPGGDLIVVDVFAFDLVRLSPAGKVTANYGSRGVDPGQFNFPNSVSVVGSTLAVADKENNRIEVLRLAKQ
jgi:hypothetical protein